MMMLGHRHGSVRVIKEVSVTVGSQVVLGFVAATVNCG